MHLSPSYVYIFMFACLLTSVDVHILHCMCVFISPLRNDDVNYVCLFAYLLL